MLGVVMLYTILGGMFSIVITDFMQFLVLAIGMAVATVAVLVSVDAGTMVAAVESNLGAAGVDPTGNPRFGWGFIVWIFVSSVAAAALWQPGTSKALASESPAVARKVFFWTGLTFAGRAMVPMLWGVGALAILGPGEDTASAMPKLLGAIVPTGFLGILVAGMLAASMSTYSAYLLAWSSVVTRDVLACFRPHDFAERTTVLITRIAAAVIGVFLLVFGLWYRIPDTAFQYLYVTGAMYTAGALACVAAGVYWKKANTVGAYAGLILGAAAPAGFLVIERFRHSLPESMAFLADVNTAGGMSFLLAAGGMAAGSLLTQRSHPPVLLQKEEPA
jgi:SSS family solute:Na+ symporter